ncbi:hypothetical protein [Streptomyces sp. A30]|uniref:hypothetical protein n=1 Tax=Streptomyces sp. A30 TaxID=2789273 RepID=UPI003980C69C
MRDPGSRAGLAAWITLPTPVAHPEPRLRAPCGYLGEEYAPETAEPHRPARTAVPAR